MDWVADNAGRLSAALAYYAVFSIAPLLVIIVSIIGFVFGEDAARGQVAGQLEGWLGADVAEAIQTAVAATSEEETAGIFATALSVGILIFGATRVVGELKASLNTIWGVVPKPGIAIKNFVRDRLLSVSLILGIGFLLLLSLTVSAAISGASEYFGEAIPASPIVWKSVDFLLSVGVITGLFVLIYKLLPDVHLKWSDPVFGAFVVALLFSLGKSALAWYLGTVGVSSGFGAAGSIIALLVWFYFGTAILFYGAEIVKCQVRNVGGTTPLSYAVPADEIPQAHPDQPAVHAEDSPKRS